MAMIRHGTGNGAITRVLHPDDVRPVSIKPMGTAVRFVPATRPPFQRRRLAESPQISPVAGVAGMRLRSVVLESWMAQEGPDQGGQPWWATTAKER